MALKTNSFFLLTFLLATVVRVSADTTDSASVQSAQKAEAVAKTEKQGNEEHGVEEKIKTESKPAGDKESGKNLQQRFDDADMVAVVKVNYISELVNPAMSVQGLVAVEGYRYTARLMRSWKGLEQQNFKFSVKLSACTKRLKAKQEYLVFGNATRYKKFQASSCEDMVPLEEAEELMVGLDKITRINVAKSDKATHSPI